MTINRKDNRSKVTADGRKARIRRATIYTLRSAEANR